MKIKNRLFCVALFHFISLSGDQNLCKYIFHFINRIFLYQRLWIVMKQPQFRGLESAGESMYGFNPYIFRLGLLTGCFICIDALVALLYSMTSFVWLK